MWPSASTFRLRWHPWVKLELCKAISDSFSDKLAIKVVELERSEKSRTVAMVEVATLAGSIPVLRSERVNEMETSVLKEARLEEHIGGL